MCASTLFSFFLKITNNELANYAKSWHNVDPQVCEIGLRWSPDSEVNVIWMGLPVKQSVPVMKSLKSFPFQWSYVPLEVIHSHPLVHLMFLLVVFLWFSWQLVIICGSSLTRSSKSRITEWLFSDILFLWNKVYLYEVTHRSKFPLTTYTVELLVLYLLRHIYPFRFTSATGLSI